MTFKINLNPNAISDLQAAIDYYEDRLPGLGRKFEKTVDRYFLTISKNPFYQVRYDNVRCLPIKKYPFMIHFVIDESALVVKIQAILHTSLNPDKNWTSK